MFLISGTCTGVVVRIGDNTVIGRIARLTGSIVEESKSKNDALSIPLPYATFRDTHCH